MLFYLNETEESLKFYMFTGIIMGMCYKNLIVVLSEIKYRGMLRLVMLHLQVGISYSFSVVGRKIMLPVPSKGDTVRCNEMNAWENVYLTVSVA